MTIINFFNKLSLYKKNKIIKLFALLGYKLNSYHSFQTEVLNLMTGSKEKIIGYNQFVSTQIKHPQHNLKVGFWKVDADVFKSKIIKKAKFYKKNKDIARNDIEFYFPLDLTQEYSPLIDLIGKPQKILEGILNPSGRSIWVFDNKNPPICLKIDTMQLSDRQFFSERVLILKGIEHSICITNYLKDQADICSEDSGGEIEFNFNSNDGTAKRYTFLKREFDFNKLDVRSSDFIIPIVALLSENFWKNNKLVKSVGIINNSIHFIENEFARCFAKLIETSLKKTFVHFEIHQQNLSIHIRKGSGLKLIYHDLQDTVFDPITFFLYQYKKNLEFRLGLSLDELFEFTFNIQKSTILNSHGQLINHSRNAKEEFTVTSIYRRYLRNFGCYNKILNYFYNLNGIKKDYYADKEFEKKILEYLNFTENELDMHQIHFNNEEDRIFLKNDLFWNIHRYQQVTQLKLLKTFLDTVFVSENMLIDKNKLNLILSSKKVFCSNGFSTCLDFIDFNLITEIYEISEQKIYKVHYDKQIYLLICF